MEAGVEEFGGEEGRGFDGVFDFFVVEFLKVGIPSIERRMSSFENNKSPEVGEDTTNGGNVGSSAEISATVFPLVEVGEMDIAEIDATRSIGAGEWIEERRVVSVRESEPLVSGRFIQIEKASHVCAQLVKIEFGGTANASVTGV